MSINLNGKYGNVGSNTLKLMNYALKNDGKIDAAEVNSIEAGAKADKNYSQGEKDLVAKLKALTKDGNEVQNLKISGFNPVQKNATFDLQIKNNEIKVEKTAETSTVTLPAQIKTSSKDFKLSRQENLTDGLKAFQYETNPKDPTQTLRAYLIDPKKVSIGVEMKKGGYDFDDIIKRKDVKLVSHGTFMVPYLPQGDIKGLDAASGKEAIYHLEKNKTAANSRYALAVEKDGDIKIVKGGLQGGDGRVNAHNPSDYAMFLGGLGTIFDGQDFKTKEEFLTYFKNNNDKSFVSNVFRKSSDDSARTSRAAVGITADGKMVMVHFGEGKFRNTDGSSVYDVYKALKAMGAVKGVLLDGGGAPKVLEKNAAGNISGTTSDERRVDPKTGNIIKGAGYDLNASFIVIKQKQ